MSSVSRTELEEMGRDELIDLIITQDERIDDLELRLDALSRWKQKTNEEIDALTDTVETLREGNQKLRSRLNEAEATAEQAFIAASRRDNQSDLSKTEMVKIATRDELVRRAASGADVTKLKFTVAEAREETDREYGEEPAWTIVMRAFRQLSDQWAAFEVTHRNGDKAIKLKKKCVRKALIRTVESSLGRDDLAKQFVGRGKEGGV